VFAADEQAKAAAEVMLPRLAPLAAEFDPDAIGGAMLLGVDGVCVISHGSSTATAMVSAIGVAHDVAVAGLVDRLARAVAPA
jgi:glycerol-3-phosphate acyltransferase PlsX